MRLIATKEMQYRTRRLKAGDEFEAPNAHGRLFVAIKKATEVREPGSIAPPPADVAKKMRKATEAAPTVSDEIKTLRAEYVSVVGRRPSPKWDAATLTEKIAAARA